MAERRVSWPGLTAAAVLVALVSLLVAGCGADDGGSAADAGLSETRAVDTPASGSDKGAVKFTIVYDNNAYDPRLRTDWGFACWIEIGDTTILFDTGGKGDILRHNLTQLGLDLAAVDAVVLSHAHGDHTGGLSAVLDSGARPTVYLPGAFPVSFKREVRQHTKVVEVNGSTLITPSARTVGPLLRGTVEQALAVETGEGPVVVTGCAHPGVERMVAEAIDPELDQDVMVIGGFHLGSAGTERVAETIRELRELGVQRVAPCHCTGDSARAMFAEAFGDQYLRAGVGWSIEIEMENR